MPRSPHATSPFRAAVRPTNPLGDRPRCSDRLPTSPAGVLDGWPPGYRARRAPSAGAWVLAELELSGGHGGAARAVRSAPRAGLGRSTGLAPERPDSSLQYAEGGPCPRRPRAPARRAPPRPSLPCSHRRLPRAQAYERRLADESELLRVRQRSQSVCRQLALLEQERSWLVDREAALVAREQLADSVLGGGDDKLELRFQHLVQLLVPGCALAPLRLRRRSHRLSPLCSHCHRRLRRRLQSHRLAPSLQSTRAAAHASPLRS